MLFKKSNRLREAILSGEVSPEAVRGLNSELLNSFDAEASNAFHPQGSSVQDIARSIGQQDTIKDTGKKIKQLMRGAAPEHASGSFRSFSGEPLGLSGKPYNSLTEGIRRDLSKFHEALEADKIKNEYKAILAAQQELGISPHTAAELYPNIKKPLISRLLKKLKSVTGSAAGVFKKAECMNTQQAYINGFVKKANEYGYSKEQALSILKNAAFEGTGFHGSRLYNALYGNKASTPQPTQQQYSGEASKPFGGMMGGMGGGFGASTQTKPSAPQPTQQQYSGEASKPFGGMMGGMGGGFGYAGKDNHQAYDQNGESWKGTGFYGSRAHEAFYGKPTQPAASKGYDAPIGPVQPETSKGYDAPIGPVQPTASPTAGGLSLGGENKVSLNSPEIQSAITQQIPQPRPMPSTATQSQAGPSNAQLAKIMGSYDPRSRLDQAKAQRIREMFAQGNTSPKAIYADKAYGAISPQSLRR